MILLKPHERLIAWRYLKSRRRAGFVSVITWFSILGIMLGVATLILVTSLMNGIRDEMQSRFIGIGGHINIYEQGGVQGYADLADALNGSDEIASAVPKVEGQVMLSSNGRALGAQVLAFPNDVFDVKADLRDASNADSVAALKAGEGVILGERLADNLGLSIGQSVLMIAPQGRQTIAGMVPRMKSYPLVGTLKLGMHLYDSSLVWMPFNDAQVYFRHKGAAEDGSEDTVSSLEVNVSDASQALAVASRLHDKLGAEYRVYDWQRSNSSLFAALQIQRNVMVIILGLIVLVAAFNIISSLIMLVQDKGTSIAILRTMGASQRSIKRIFSACGVWIGLVGTALGLVLGLLLASNIEGIKNFVESLTGQEILVEEVYFLSTLPTKTNWTEVVVIVIGAVVISYLATLPPARRAARIQPAEALRYE